MSVAARLGMVILLLVAAHVTLAAPSPADPASVFAEALADDESQAPDPTGRAAVPDEAARKAAQKVIRELLANEFADATPKGKRALATALLARGEALTDDPAGCYEMLSEACDAAIEAGDLDAAIKATSELGRRYDINTLAQKAGVLTRLAPKRTLPADAALAAAHGLAVAQAMVHREMYADAQRLTPIVREAAAASHNTKTQIQVRDKLGVVEATCTQYAQASAAMDKLKANPNDAESNLTAGRFQCFVRVDFDKGLPLLAKGADPALQAAAAADLANPTTGSARKALGDAWWDQAARENKDAAAAEQCKGRAGYWYRLGMPQLNGLERIVVEQRLASLPAPATGDGARASVPPTAVPAGSPGAGGDTYPAAEDPLADKLPSVDALRSVQSTAKEVFANDPHDLLRKARTQATDPKNEPAVQYAVLLEAANAATSAGDADTIMWISDELARRYPRASVEVRFDVLDRAVGSAKTADGNRELGDGLLALADDAGWAGEFPTALRAAERAMPQVSSPYAAEKVQVLREIVAIADTMRNGTKEPKDSVRTGLFLCFATGQLELGLPMLAKGDDPQLAAVAAKEARAALSPEDAIALADSYMEIATVKSRSALVRSGAAARAAWWYGQALPRASGVSKTDVEKKCAESTQLSAWMSRPMAIESLHSALLSSMWGWHGPDVQMTFKENGTVSHRGMHGHWKMATNRLVILSISNGDTMYFHFNADLTHYISLGRGFGGDRLASRG